MNEKMKKFEELLKDEAKGKAVFGKTLEETQKNLADEGLEFTLEELTDIVKGLAESDVDAGAELTETDLENVAGGSYQSDCYKWGKNIGKVFVWAVKAAKFIYGCLG